ncbi:MAG: hypothetical protein IPN54_14910 [Bacteroidetes bacterium]|nr:hypothetical protein [Bacteroidota bacterium]
MKNLLKFLSLLLIASTLSLFVISCGDDDDEPSPTPTPTATCSDGIQNQGETGIDCGGPCAACPTATCSDGIQNQGETGIDCGGPCAPCPTVGDTSYTAKVDGIVWEADVITVSNTPSNKITLIGIDNSTGTRITLTYSGPFATGPAVSIGSTFVAEYRNAVGTPFGGISGSITFTKFNTTSKVISATFSCNVKDNNANITKIITNGVIENIEY